MNFDFELILFYATVISGAIVLIDRLFFMKKRNEQNRKMPFIADYAHSFFPVLLIVFLLRSFLFEPYRIPSGSLEPTLAIGDFIVVNKFDYGIRLPVIHKEVVPLSHPHRGDIVLFRFPPKPSVVYIKRVIGVPGDKIKYINKELYINGEKIQQTFVKDAVSEDELGQNENVKEMQEKLFNVTHSIYVNPDRDSRDFQEITVPDNMYFMMGDNRDDSADSRYWGFVPDANLIGQATRVWMSWDHTVNRIRFDRIGKKIT